MGIKILNFFMEKKVILLENVYLKRRRFRQQRCEERHNKGAYERSYRCALIVLCSIFISCSSCVTSGYSIGIIGICLFIWSYFFAHTFWIRRVIFYLLLLLLTLLRLLYLLYTLTYLISNIGSVVIAVNVVIITLSTCSKNANVISVKEKVSYKLESAYEV